MIKTHFPQSQFIVVSLKEGMFNNANIIFRTKFVDGVSTVARTVPTLSDRPATAPSASNKVPLAAMEKVANRNVSGIAHAAVSRCPPISL
jgi:structural maintenance of chromosome 2